MVNSTRMDNTESPWEMVNPTPNSHIISFPASTLQSLEVGDCIGAFSPNGICAGYFEIDNTAENHVMTVFADDYLTDEIDGFIEDELFTFRLFRTSTKNEYDVSVEFSNELPDAEFFASEGMSRVESLSHNATRIPIQPESFSVFPNPANERVRIQLSAGESAKVEVINKLGQVVTSLSVTDYKILDTSTWSKGIYLFRLTSKNLNVSKKVIIL